MEYEFTVSLVFGGRIYHIMLDLLGRVPHIEEDLDVYTKQSVSTDKESTTEIYRYRELRQRVPNADDRNEFITLRDCKTQKRCVESQVPYVDAESGRVLFVTTTYKVATERQLSEEEWTETIREDHSSNTCLRVANKHRLSFPPEQFTERFNGLVPRFTRLSLGEYSTYGGTLEARTKCNPVYYLEIEQELDSESTDVVEDMLHLVDTLFHVVPYNLVAETVRDQSVASVQRERVDNIFDEYKRRFVDYNRWRHFFASASSGSSITPPLHAYIMPKWDGVKATANYCNGFMFIRDACGSLATYRVDLPFDNDLLLQLEIIDDNKNNKETDTDFRQHRFFVVTEILAVHVKNHNTLYHVYNRNNNILDTGRNAGNVCNSITLKKQFVDPNNICNTYRLVAPELSLLVLHHLGASYIGCRPQESTQHIATNTYMSADETVVLLTTVVRASSREDINDVLNTLNRFHSISNGTPSAKTVRSICIDRLCKRLPEWLLQDRRFQRFIEGLLVAFVNKQSPVCREEFSKKHHRTTTVFDYGYIKVKPVDTVELQYHIGSSVATSAGDRHRFRVQGVPSQFPGWAERASTINNNRVIIECYFDNGTLIFLKDRPDKSKADNDEKISAINRDIITSCAF